jgi:hypothetical protein
MMLAFLMGYPEPLVSEFCLVILSAATLLLKQARLDAIKPQNGAARSRDTRL